MNKREIGNKYEEKAVEYLSREGYSIIERNFYSRNGEIDIIASESGYLCFIEVRYRRNGECGHPSESVDVRKRKRIISTAKYYLYLRGYGEEQSCRFDVVVILEDEVMLIKDAFQIE